MRKNLIAIAVLLLLAAACSKSSSTPTAGGSEPAKPGGQLVTSLPPGGGADCPDLSGDNPFKIKIKDFAFVPDCLTASGSASITIVNEDQTDHNFTIDGTQISVPVNAGQTFNGESAGLSPGTYQFHCAIHPTMTGTITVV